LIFNKIKNILGGRSRCMVTASAPINPDVLDFLKIAFCNPILEGYGQTESCGASVLSVMEDPLSGQVGGPIGSSKIRLRDVPEMNYLSTDIPYPRGEI
jgi:long-chain acyl-CoA synthetase